MFKKAASKWVFAFLAGVILTAGVILMVVVIPGFFHTELCPRAQEREIQNVYIKVEEMRGKAGYETMYFEVKECVEEIKYVESDNSKSITVKYTTANTPIPYFTNAEWIKSQPYGDPMDLVEPGTYYFRVSEGSVKELSKVS